MSTEAHFEDFYQLICDVCAQLGANEPFQYAWATCPTAKADKPVILTLAAMIRRLWEFPEWILFWFSSPPAIDHVSHLESRYCCKDFWVVIGFLYLVSQPSLLPLVNFSSQSLWECGCGLMPSPGDPIISSSSHGQWSGLTCPGLIADTHPFQPTKILSLF